MTLKPLESTWESLSHIEHIGGGSCGKAVGRRICAGARFQDFIGQVHRSTPAVYGGSPDGSPRQRIEIQHLTDDGIF